jgi:hypothetical protein
MNSIRIIKEDQSTPVLGVTDQGCIAISQGVLFEKDGRSVTPRAGEFSTELMTAGRDYCLLVDDKDHSEWIIAEAEGNPISAGAVAGFHYAPGGNAKGTEGGDPTPAINSNSIWDLDFRPACPDPRGMTLVTASGRRIWVDIYLLGTEHRERGTSSFSATIADGRDLPQAADEEGKALNLDFHTASAIYASHGKRLLKAEEFFAAAYGIKERCSRSDEPKRCGEMTDDAQRFISQVGLFDVTGTMWQWGTDGHPDDPRPSIFGGSWLNGSSAGSRYAHLVCWPGHSNGHVSARGACDHL